MSDFVVGLALGVIVGSLFAASVAKGVYDFTEKSACEEHLPRNVECTWQPPQEQDND